MCTTCGCGVGEARVAGQALPAPGKAGGESSTQAQAGSGVAALQGRRAATSYRPSGSVVDQPGGRRWPAPTHAHPPGDAAGHVHAHPHEDLHDSPFTAGHAHHGHDHATHYAPESSQSRLVQIERDILASNDGYAAENRKRFEEQGIFALNLVSSPGSGKTTLLCRTIELLRARLPMAVIEGDQQTGRDAERIRETGVPALQINTGKGCHLDAHMVGHALQQLSPADDSLLLIENVGNLVCPAAFDLGEAHKVIILSVTEGEDKPLKYPNMFHAASLMLLNKVDLLPYLSFDAELAIRYAQQVNPALQVIQVSATTGEGFDQWLDWLMEGCAAVRERKQATVAGLRRRIAELETLLTTGARG